MEIDKKVETLEDEFKLIKGELKQTLESVRDYLLETPIPASEYATIMAAIGGGGGGGGQTMEGKLSFDKGDEEKEESPEGDEEMVEEEMPREEYHQGERPEEELTEEELPEDKLYEEELPEGELPEDKLYEEKLPEGELPEDKLYEEELPEGELPEGELADGEFPETRTRGGKIDVGREVAQSIPPVNLMANLIRWVANAKRELGGEQLPTFLEVYGITGYLSPELKEVILHLADITAEQSAETNVAEIWTHLMLVLHGILTGSEAPLHPVVKPFWNDGDGETLTSVPELEAGAERKGKEKTEKAEDKPKDRPLKLKLVFPNGDGTDKEFSLVLNPDEAKKGH